MILWWVWGERRWNGKLRSPIRGPGGFFYQAKSARLDGHVWIGNQWGCWGQTLVINKRISQEIPHWNLRVLCMWWLKRDDNWNGTQRSDLRWRAATQTHLYRAIVGIQTRAARDASESHLHPSTSLNDKFHWRLSLILNINMLNPTYLYKFTR